MDIFTDVPLTNIKTEDPQTEKEYLTERIIEQTVKTLTELGWTPPVQGKEKRIDRECPVCCGRVMPSSGIISDPCRYVCRDCSFWINRKPVKDAGLLWVEWDERFPRNKGGR